MVSWPVDIPNWGREEQGRLHSDGGPVRGDPMRTIQGRARCCALCRALSAMLLVIVWCGSSAAALGQAPPQTRGLKPTDAPPASTIQAGSYYALVIGINDYKY